MVRRDGTVNRGRTTRARAGAERQRNSGGRRYGAAARRRTCRRLRSQSPRCQRRLNKQGVTDFAGVAQRSTSINFTPYPSSSNTLILYSAARASRMRTKLRRTAHGWTLRGRLLHRPSSRLETFDLADVGCASKFCAARRTPLRSQHHRRCRSTSSARNPPASSTSRAHRWRQCHRAGRAGESADRRWGLSASIRAVQQPRPAT